MKNVFRIVLLCCLTNQAFAQVEGAPIYGTECTVDTYDSAAESSQIGGFDSDSLPGAYRPLADQLKTSGFKLRRKDYTKPVIHYFKDTEFLVELKMNSGRGANRNFSITLMNTGRFGVYSTLFFVEIPNSGNTLADALKLIGMLPECVRRR